MSRIPVARALHDIGLATWFGGTLMGAVGLNGAAASVADPAAHSRVATAGWARWAPVQGAAIGVHLIGGALLVREKSQRIAAQKGVAAWTLTKAGLTGAALLATMGSGLAGAKLMKAGDFPAAGATDPLPETPPELGRAQKQLKALQWVIPALTGAILYSNAVMGEQQRPVEVAKGAIARLGQTAHAAASHPRHAAALASHLLA